MVGTQVDAEQPLNEAGLDSIGSVELRNAASALCGKELPATLAFDYPSIRAIAGFITSQLQSSDGQTTDDGHTDAGIAEAEENIKKACSLPSLLRCGLSNLSKLLCCC